MKAINLKARKQGGFILTTELILIVTILVIGMTVGLVTMRDAVTAEMEDVAEAIGSLDQSYAFNGLANPQLSASLEGSSFGDEVDTNAGDESFRKKYICNSCKAGFICAGSIFFYSASESPISFCRTNHD